jgi:hypothetical protein
MLLVALMDVPGMISMPKVLVFMGTDSLPRGCAADEVWWT